MAQTVGIVSGPDKPGLQWSVAYPETAHVHFEIDGDVAGDTLKAQIREMTEHADGVTFGLQGTVLSRPHDGASFRATYHVGSRTGSMEISGLEPARAETPQAAEARIEVCPECQGTGQIEGSPCAACSGSGSAVVYEERREGGLSDSATVRSGDGELPKAQPPFREPGRRTSNPNPPREQRDVER